MLHKKIGCAYSNQQLDSRLNMWKRSTIWQIFINFSGQLWKFSERWMRCLPSTQARRWTTLLAFCSKAETNKGDFRQDTSSDFIFRETVRWQRTILSNRRTLSFN